MANKDLYLKTFCNFLSHFSLQEIEDVVFKKIEIGLFKKIILELLEQKMPLTRGSVIKIVFNEHLGTKSLDWLKKNLSTLRLLDVALHNQKLKWSAYRLKKNDGHIYKNCSRIEETIQTRIVNLQKIMDVDVIAHECLYWISMIETIRIPGRGATVKPPMFVGYVVGQPYFFITQNGRKEVFLNVISKSLGYKIFEDCNLSGKNIHHLLQLLNNREACASCANDVLDWNNEYKAAPAVKTERGAEYVQELEEEKYFRKHFPNEPTIQHVVPALEGKQTNKMKCTFQSENLMQMFHELGKKGLLTVPLPEHIGALQTNAMDSYELKQSSLRTPNQRNQFTVISPNFGTPKGRTLKEIYEVRVCTI
ncbi:hypothetical protein C0J52_16588 [Blattella germanica]|nr:hypothetical protein C0J52_16588 [Blattella germanica]